MACAICYLEINSRQVPCLECGEKYHRNCLINAVTTKKRCPVYQQPFSHDHLYRHEVQAQDYEELVPLNFKRDWGGFTTILLLSAVLGFVGFVGGNTGMLVLGFFVFALTLLIMGLLSL